MPASRKLVIVGRGRCSETGRILAYVALDPAHGEIESVQQRQEEWYRLSRALLDAGCLMPK